MERYALLLGSSQFDDNIYEEMPFVKNDINEFETVLKKYGDFKESNIKKLIDKPAYDCREEIEDFLERVSEKDLFLFYYSGHGDIDAEANELYFIMKNTKHNKLISTSIEKDLIIRCVEKNKPRARIFIIDCCYSGAFSKGLTKSGKQQIVKRDMEKCIEDGSGSYIIAGGRPRQELTQPTSGKYSLFTKVILEGLKSEEAAASDGKVYPDGLFDYIQKYEIEGHNPVANFRNIESKNGLHIVTIRKESGFEAYDENIINNYSKIKVMGYKFNLENIYISLRVSRGKNGYIYIKNHGEKDSYTTQELVSFNKNKIVVIADPGKGKTTLLKYLRWFVSKSINGISAVLIKLKDYEKSNLELLSIVIDDFQSKAAIKRENIITALENGKLIILLDGLDEVDERLQSGIVKKIEKFTNIYSKCRLILTLRETLYKEYERKESEVTEFIDRCSLFEIDDLANDEIEKFVKVFYDEVLVGQGNDKIDEKVYELLSSINKNLEIRKMSKNPLLLSVLSLVGKDKELPKYRNELYRECTMILIDRKDKSIGECVISKIELLMDIAYGAFIDGGKSEFDLGELMTKIQNFIENRKDCKDCLASKCIKSLCNDSGILKSFGNRKYGFIHRTFCEYYAALKLKKLTFNDVCSKMESVMWEEPLKLYAAELDNISDSKNFIEKVWVVNRKLAIRCFTEMKFVNKKMVEGLLKETKVSERIELVEGLVFVEHNEKENNAGAMLDILIVFLELQRDLEIMAHVILKLRSIQGRFENTENADNKEISIEIDKIIEKYTGSKEAKRDRYKKYIEDLMVNITGGEFMMGSPEDEPEREDIEVLHRVRVDSFKMMKHTVTLDLFNKVMDGEGVKFYRDNDRGSIVWNSDKNKWELKSGVNFKCDVNGNDRQDQSHPVIHVNWYEAWMFCELLGCKLPTEAQWEYACRATTNVETLDTEVADKNVCTNMPFNTGENLPTDKSNYDGNYPYNNNQKGEYKQDTMPVMSYEPNGFDLFEMHGNVWEWCNDWYDENYYKVCIDEKIIENPSGPEEGSYRVLRGGSWYSFARYCRSADRSNDNPSFRGNFTGFRVVWSP